MIALRRVCRSIGRVARWLAWSHKATQPDPDVEDFLTVATAIDTCADSIAGALHAHHPELDREGARTALASELWQATLDITQALEAHRRLWP